jgi:hypothetical protein
MAEGAYSATEGSPTSGEESLPTEDTAINADQRFIPKGLLKWYRSQIVFGRRRVRISVGHQPSRLCFRVHSLNFSISAKLLPSRYLPILYVILVRMLHILANDK